MTAMRSSIFVGLLLAAIFCCADSDSGNSFSASEYRAQLDQLLTATHDLDSSGRPLPSALRGLPNSWKVHTDRQDFEVPAEGLRSDVLQFEKERNVTNATAIRQRILSLRNDLDGFQDTPAQISASQQHLASILARPEFRDVRGPSFLDRLQQRIAEWLIRILGRLFSSSAIPTISRYLVYGLIGLAVLALGFLVYRHIRSLDERIGVVPQDVPVSARNFALWLSDARAAAVRNNWREAIHLAYWAGISFLEERGAWKADRARTPREYLRMLSKSSDLRQPLTSLTQDFELAWYARRDADEQVFVRTMQALEKLGCHPS